MGFSLFISFSVSLLLHFFCLGSWVVVHGKYIIFRDIISLNGFGEQFTQHTFLVVVVAYTVVDMSSFHCLFFDEMFIKLCGDVGMMIPNGSAQCCTCTGEPTSITMHIGRGGGGGGGGGGTERAMGAVVSPLF